MEYLFIYIALSIFCTVLFICMFMTRTSDLPYLSIRLVVELGFDEDLAGRIQYVCDTFRQGDPEFTDIVIVQCALAGHVAGDEANQIIEQFPGMIDSPIELRNKCFVNTVTFDELLDIMGVVRS